MFLRKSLPFILSSLFLCVFCYSADYILFGRHREWEKILHGQELRAVFDCAVHGVVAGWSWMNYSLIVLKFGHKEWQLSQVSIHVVACILVGTVIDVDHVIEAGSLSINDALHLKARPFLHNSSIIPIGALVVQFLLFLLPSKAQDSAIVNQLPSILIISIASHHLRDGERRGLWVAPFGSTPPIPHKLYILMTLTLPVCLAIIPILPSKLQEFVHFNHVPIRTKTSDLVAV